jgi:hypothetical protein
MIRKWAPVPMLGLDFYARMAHTSASVSRGTKGRLQKALAILEAALGHYCFDLLQTFANP